MLRKFKHQKKNLNTSILQLKKYQYFREGIIDSGERDDARGMIAEGESGKAKKN